MFCEACLLFLVLTPCIMDGASSKSTSVFNRFHSIFFGNGTARCILNAPTAKLVSRSAISCGIKCLETTPAVCYFFNYFSASKRCEIFCFTVTKFGLVTTCRSYRLQVAASTINVLTLTADDVIRKLYFDGLQMTSLPNASIWDATDKVALPFQITVIAVQVENSNAAGGGYGGLLASDSSGRIISDSSWRCFFNTAPPANWMNVNFDDSGWIDAAGLFNNSGSQIYAAIPGINPNAWWIWNQEKSTNLNVYFRLRLY